MSALPLWLGTREGTSGVFGRAFGLKAAWVSFRCTAGMRIDSSLPHEFAASPSGQ